MFNKKRILKHAVSDPSFPTIASSKSFVPSWYKDQPRFPDNLKEIKKLPHPLTFKMCSAFGDSFISGYTIPLPVDIAVEKTENGPIISWSSQADPSGFLSVRDKALSENLPTPTGFYDVHFVWLTKHCLKIPKGYSVLITHPFNRYELPFLTLTGIVDGEYTMPKGNVPVFFKEGFEGIIPAGTPIMQILPFKTENWTSEEDSLIIKEADINDKKSINLAYGWYKKNIWKRKMYE